MSVRARITVYMFSLAAMFVVASHLMQRAFIYPHFVELEQSKATHDLGRCMDALEREREQLSAYTYSRASRDDAYQFMSDRNEDYVANKLSPHGFVLANCNLRFYVDPSGAVVFGKILDLTTQAEIELLQFPSDRWPANHPLLEQAADDQPIDELMLTDRGLMLLSVHRILKSNDEGPSRGVLVQGRLLTPDLVSKLVRQTGVTFRVWPDASEPTPTEAALVLREFRTSRAMHVDNRDRTQRHTYGGLFNRRGEAVATIRADLTREISSRGKAAATAAAGAASLLGLLTALALLVLLRSAITAPLDALAKHATALGASGDLTHRLDTTRNDEFGQLARSLNQMAERLLESRRDLSDAARRAGMSEVASGVLHNVGNVLNSMNVSSELVTDRVRKLRVSGLERASELLEKNSGKLGEFLAQDERGQRLPTYLAELALLFAEDQKCLLSELSQLRSGIEHVNQIVQSQQGFAGVVGLFEPILPKALVDTAVTVMSSGFVRHEIDVRTDVADMPAIQTDRAKVLQILVNLLANAKDALGDAASREKRIVVRAVLDSNQFVSFSVTDNGTGIAPEALDRIFEHGFTTKSDGRGYGLHYCANAAAELGGKLTASSAGRGAGATFTLELPMTQPAAPSPKVNA